MHSLFFVAALSVINLLSANSAAPIHNPVAFTWDKVDRDINGQTIPVDVFYKLVVDGAIESTGTSTVSKEYTLDVGEHFVYVYAVEAGGLSSAFSPRLTFTVEADPDPACQTPLGNRAVSIFPTNLQKTGSGGALSKARMDFQLASPNSPIVHVAVRSKGQDLKMMDARDDSNLESIAGIWFIVPATPGVYPISILARNLYGCTTELLTTKSVEVK